MNTNQYNNFDAIIAWSNLSASPIIAYLPKHDSYLCVWADTIFPLTTVQYYVFSLSDVSSQPGPNMRTKLFNEYTRLACSGVFDSLPFNPYAFPDEYTYAKYVKKTVKELMESFKFTKSEIIRKFNLADVTSIDV